MAIIKCPECGKDVSDKANACPNCGCPVAKLSSPNVVKIKLSVLKVAKYYDQRVQILSDDKVIWEGTVGQIAEIHTDKPMNILIKYVFDAYHFGGKCKGVIDPRVSPKYTVTAWRGLASVKLAMESVDVFDAD